jgi:5-deoxy-5-amino-3-dehydroquinate synthase
MTNHKINVALADRSYSVLVGSGASKELENFLPKSAKRAVIVTQENIPFSITLSLPYTTVLVGNGEQFKSLQTIETISEQFAKFGLTRSDVVIGLGGGMVTDIAGFAAASWHRGTAVVQIPTTLVGMVDAAIGGKTGVNRIGSAGKAHELSRF